MQQLAKPEGFSEQCGFPVTSRKIFTGPDLMEVVAGNLFSALSLSNRIFFLKKYRSLGWI